MLLLPTTLSSFDPPKYVEPMKQKSQEHNTSAQAVLLSLKLLLSLGRTLHSEPTSHLYPSLTTLIPSPVPCAQLPPDSPPARMLPPSPCPFPLPAQASAPHSRPRVVPHACPQEPQLLSKSCSQVPSTWPLRRHPGPSYNPAPYLPTHPEALALLPYLRHSHLAPHHMPAPHPVPSQPGQSPNPVPSFPSPSSPLTRPPALTYCSVTELRPWPGPIATAVLGEFRPPSLLRRTSRAPPRATRNPRPRAPHVTAQRRTAGQRRASSLAGPGQSQSVDACFLATAERRGGVADGIPSKEYRLFPQVPPPRIANPALLKDSGVS